MLGFGYAHPEVPNDFFDYRFFGITTWDWIGILAILGLVTFGLSSCSPAYAESVYKTQLDQTVRIESTDGVGSGVVISKDTVLTAEHVVEGEAEVSIMFRGELIGLKGKVLKRFPELDLALVQIKFPEGVKLPVVSCQHVDAGLPTILVGMPYGLDWVVTLGIVSNDELVNDRRLLSNKSDHGNSGGPVYNDKGVLIGILLNGIGGKTKDGEGNFGTSFGGFIPTELFCKELNLKEGVN